MSEENASRPESPEEQQAPQKQPSEKEAATSTPPPEPDAAPKAVADDKPDKPDKPEKPEKPEMPESGGAPREGGGGKAPGTPEEGEKPEGKKEEKRDIFAEIMGDDRTEALKILKAKASKHVTKGIVHITATFNNTVVTITDQSGNSIGWSSSGKMGFKGSRKSTAYAAQVVSQDACRQAMGHGLKEAEVRVKGPGSGRESAVRAVQNIGIDIIAIKDVTPIPHNGCRPKKARRV